MAWPTIPVVTTGLDQDTDEIPRTALLDLTTKFNDVIAARAAANGVCELDATSLVPVSRIPASIARLTLTGNQAINEARANIAMDATLMNLWAGPSILDGTGTAPTITTMADAPQAGARRVLYPPPGTVLVHGATFDIDGNANRTAQAGERWEFIAKTVNTFRVHVTKDDGTPVDLANSGVVPGTYGGTSDVPVITFDAKGRATACTTIPSGNGVHTVNSWVLASYATPSAGDISPGQVFSGANLQVGYIGYNTNNGNVIYGDPAATLPGNWEAVSYGYGAPGVRGLALFRRSS